MDETSPLPPETNDTGATVTELPSSASEPPLIAEIIPNATQAVVPPSATIRFDANITGGAPPYSYIWYGVGGNTVLHVIDNDRSITQRFFDPDTATIILIVTDSSGKTVNDAVQIVISERLPQGGGAIAPEPEGIAPPPEEGGGAILEPVVPPPTAPDEGGGEEEQLVPSDEEPDEGDTTGGEESPPSPPSDDTGEGEGG